MGIRSIFIAAGLIASAALSLPAHATNIVSNPGFETDATLLTGTCDGTIPNTGQSPSCVGPTGWSVSGDAGEDMANPNSGSVDAFLGSGALSQDLMTIAGATYTISFYLAADQSTLDNALYSLFGIGGYDATVDVGFGSDDVTTAALGAPIDALNDYFLVGASAGSYVPPSPWTFTDMASSTSTALTFTGSNPSGTWYIDDVDVECTAACQTPTPVPEPPSILLLLSALAMTARVTTRAKKTRSDPDVA
jgi:hypothetical protein